MPWRVLEHTADVRLEVEAADWPALLEEAARAFGGFLGGGQAAAGGGTEMRALEVSGTDAAETWVRWWRGLLRLWTVEKLLPVDVRVLHATPEHAAGEARCVPAAALDLRACADVKAVTWHAASAGPAPGGVWRGTIVLDV